MPELDDKALLQEYAAERSDQAFAALVNRYVDLVYSSALRQLRDSHRAAEVTQTTFVILASKAGRLRSGTLLPGWLMRTVRFAAMAERRSAIRRQRYETEARMDPAHQHEADVNPTWDEVAPVLDDALAQLSERDRSAIVLRYFKDKPLSEVGQALGLDQDAAQKRVSRALEKLRRYFLKRGIAFPVLTVVTLISANAVQAAPTGLVASVTATAALQGATATTTTTALVHGTLKLMAWTKAKTTAAIAAGLLLVASTATVTVSQFVVHNDSVRAQAFDIIRTNNWRFLSDDAELQMLLAIGPKALPALSELVGWRNTALRREYAKLWPSLPGFLRQRFQNPKLVQDLHRKAVQIVFELGPAVARPLTGALCGAVDESAPGTRNYALDSLYWSIPESKAAATAFVRCLSDPSRSDLFHSTDGWEIFPQVPQVLPLLISCLRNPQLAREAAIGLGKFGSEATNAVSALVEVCDAGVANPPLTPNSKVHYASADEPLLWNRCAAFETLGQIGSVSPEVLAAVHRGLTDGQEDIRFAALGALATLHQPLDENLTNVLSTFAVRRSIKFLKIVEWVGTLGNDGRKALPWLQGFVDADFVRNLPEGIKANVGDFTIDVETFRLTAILAICRINPDATRVYLPDLLAQFSGRWEPVEWLAGSKSLATEIITALEPKLAETNSLRAARAAFAILALNPRHAQALEALRGGLARGTLNERLISASWLWRRLGETNVALPLLIEGLAAPESHIGQNAANTLAKFGPQGRAAVPALKAALWHKDRYVRERAGKALRKIAPEEMPPIR